MKRGKTPHPTQEKNDKPPTYRRILNLRETPLSNDNSANTLIIQVGQWSKQTRPVIELRRMYKTVKGDLRSRKMRGMDLDDWIFCLNHNDEIIAALRG